MTVEVRHVPIPREYRILVVDDERDVLEMTAEVLRSAGWTVDAFSSPTDALAKARSRIYDALILDIYMPEMPGLLFHAKLKLVDPELVDHTVFVSGYITSNELRRELERTPRFVSKPFRVEILVGAVGMVLPEVPRARRVPRGAVSGAAASDRPAGTRGRS